MQTAIVTRVRDRRPASFHTAGLPSTKLVNIRSAAGRKISLARENSPRPTLNRKYLARIPAEHGPRQVARQVLHGQRLKFRSIQDPLLPLLRFTVSSSLLMLAAHGRRHMWQAEQGTREPDFPHWNCNQCFLRLRTSPSCRLASADSAPAAYRMAVRSNRSPPLQAHPAIPLSPETARLRSPAAID